MHMHKKYKDVKIFFKENLPQLNVNKKLIKDLKSFRLDWCTKDSDYIDFLGSNLLGVHSIAFSVLDDTKLMTTIFKIHDYRELQKEIWLTTGIEKEYKIGSNIIYNVLMYTAYLFVNDKSLSEKEKNAGIRELCLIMQYKQFSSVYNHSFKWKPTEAIANAVYNKLSHKFIIKRLNNWQEVFEFRADSCINDKELNYGRLRKYNSETAIRLITDIQIKLKEQIKHIYGVLDKITKANDYVIQESSTFIGGDNNDEQMNDVTNNIGAYIVNMKSIAFIPNDFISNEIINIVASLFKNMDRTLVYTFLRYMTDSDHVNTHKLTSNIESILVITFRYLQQNNINIENRETIPQALLLVKNFWSASKVKDAKMDDIKTDIVSDAFKCTGKRTGHVLVTISLSYIVYIFLRSLKK